MTTTPVTASVSASPPLVGKVTLHTLREMKKRREAIAMLTAYDHPTAKILAAAGVAILLVGDSVATTVLGAESTVKATLEFLLTLTEAVRRGAPDVFLMADMPFGSYPDVPTAVANASRFMRETGADCVKLEADIRHRETVAALSAAGVIVCAHVGLLPQRAMQQGGYFAQGRTSAEARRLVEEAVTLAEAGAHLLLVEAVPDEVTAEIVRKVECPVLGCGAGPSADGHVVVINDMLGYSKRPPRFVEPLADVPGMIQAAAVRYVESIRDRSYPAARHQYRMKAE
jgi:3-methyl-2-oxobutanoate hydroxymethyltransferase